jgi:tRNA1(Val) A37 N6-methylase TrmN6
MSRNCQISTPVEYVNKMLDYMNYSTNLYGKSILENSCGNGNILLGVVKRYIESAKKEGYSNKDIIVGLENDITAYDIDNRCVAKCIERLNNLALQYEIFEVNWNVQKKDYLFCERKKYSYIIGNPPYITYHDLNLKQREKIRNKYVSCKKGRFDYCYAFIEASISDLETDGKIVYLVPYSIFRNKYASELRNILKRNLKSIYDYCGYKIFLGVVTSSAIIVYEDSYSKEINYYNIKHNTYKAIEKALLGDKWIFGEKRTKQRRFGDYFKISNSVATLHNKAFVIKMYEEDQTFIYVNGKPIEHELVYEAVSVKSIKYNKNIEKKDRIIFPYKINGDKSESFTEEEFRKRFPFAYNYLKNHKKKLDERKVDKSVNWFEYGRRQSINDILGEKVIIPMVFTNRVNAYIVNGNTIPYAGYFIKKCTYSSMELSMAKSILESSEFYNYVKEYGTPTTTTSYRISVKDICDYTF